MGPYPFTPMPASGRRLSYSDTGVLRAVLMQEEVRYIPDPKSGYREIVELPSSSEGQASTDGFGPDKRFTGEPSSPLRKCKLDYECEFDPTRGTRDLPNAKFPGICADKGLLSPVSLPVRNTTRKRSNSGDSSPFPPAIQHGFEIQAEVQGPGGQSYLADSASRARNVSISSLHPLPHMPHMPHTTNTPDPLDFRNRNSQCRCQSRVRSRRVHPERNREGRGQRGVCIPRPKSSRIRHSANPKKARCS